MSKYLTFYAVVPQVEIFPALMMWEVGTTDDGNTVYICLDTEEDAVEHIYNCWQCYDSTELLYGDYPEMEDSQVTTDDEGNEYVNYRLDTRVIA